MKKIITKSTVIGLISLIVVFGLATVSQAAINVGLEYATATGLGTKDIRTSIATVINVFMGLLGTVAVVIILIGGFKWMTAGGAEEKVGEAKKLITAGIIGLAIILAAYSIATFVVGSLVNAT